MANTRLKLWVEDARETLVYGLGDHRIGFRGRPLVLDLFVASGRKGLGLWLVRRVHHFDDLGEFVVYFAGAIGVGS